MSGLEVTCWKCGGELEDLLLPLSRTEECRHCGADLHVCRMCRFYDTSVSNACREPVAEFVADKTRANFCGYLELRTDAGSDHGGTGEEAMKQDLNALFGLDSGGDAPRGSDDAQAALDELFGRKNEGEE